MGEYSNRVQTHPIQNTISNYEAAIDKIDEKGLVKAETLDDFERIKVIYRLLKKALLQDPNLIPTAPLNNLNNALQSSLNELNNFINNHNNAHLRNANSHFDTLLTYLAQINLQSSLLPSDYAVTLESFRKSAGQFSHYIEDEFKKLKSDYEELKKHFNDLKSQINTQTTRLDNAINNFQTQFTEAERKRSENFNNAEIKRTGTYDTSINSQKEKNEKMNNSFIEQHGKTLKVFEDDSQKLLTSIKSDTDSLVHNLKEKKDEAERLVNIIANTGMAGGYQKVANEARKAKMIWQIATSIALVGLIVFAIIAFLSAVSGDFNFGKFGSRVFAAISFGIFAAYSAREAEKSSNQEAKNRQIELELASIDLYLAKLPEEKQNEIKSELAKKWFGNLPNIELIKNDGFNGNAYELIKMVLNNLSKLK